MTFITSTRHAPEEPLHSILSPFVGLFLGPGGGGVGHWHLVQFCFGVETG